MRFKKIKWKATRYMQYVGIIVNTYMPTYDIIQRTVNVLQNDYPHLRPEQIIVTHVDNDYDALSGQVIAYADAAFAHPDYDTIRKGVVKV